MNISLLERLALDHKNARIALSYSSPDPRERKILASEMSRNRRRLLEVLEEEEMKTTVINLKAMADQQSLKVSRLRAMKSDPSLSSIERASLRAEFEHEQARLFDLLTQLHSTTGD